MDVTQLDRPILPGAQNLLESLATQVVTSPDLRGAPPGDEIELNELALQVGARMLRKHRNLRRKTDFISANGVAQVIDAHPRERLVQRSRTALASGRSLDFPKPGAANARLLPGPRRRDDPSKYSRRGHKGYSAVAESPSSSEGFRNRYPTQGSVWMYAGFAGSSSIFLRSMRT